MMPVGLRRGLMIAALALPALTFAAPKASADKADFWIVNDSSTVMTELYLSSSGRSTWDNDVLGTEVLEIGDRRQITFGDISSEQCLYDIRAVFSGGQVAEQFQVNVCDADFYRFFDQDEAVSDDSEYGEGVF
jgi:hypothetical protein